MKSIYDCLIKSFKRTLKSVQADNSGVIVKIEMEKPTDRNRPLTVLFRKIDPAVRIPERKGVAWDLYLPQDVQIEAGQTVRIPLGFACKLPDGYCALILSRSSTWEKWGLCLGNQLGLVDGSYCGDNDEWQLLTYRPNSYKNYPATIPAGTRICQFILARTAPDLNFEIVDSLPDPSRGGFGSTGV